MVRLESTVPSVRSVLTPTRSISTVPIRYAVAVALAAMAVLLTLLVGDLQDRTPYLFSFAAVMLASWYGGLGPGIVATLVSTLAVDYYALSPVNDITLTSGENALTAVLFIGVAAMVSWLNAARLRTEEELDRLLREERTARADADAARGEAIAGREGMRFLAEVSAELAKSLDHEETLRRVADLVVPGLADWCAVHLVGKDEAAEQLVIAHVDPDKVVWARHLQERYPTDPQAEFGLPQVLRTSRPELYAEISDEMLVRGAKDAEHLAILRSVGMTSAMIVPMVSRGRMLGAISFVAAESGRRYGAEDLALAELLARRCAQAVDNARLYREAQDAEARYRSLFEGTAEAVLVASLDGGYVDANAAATELLGYTREEIRHLRLGDVSRSGGNWANGEQPPLLGEGTWRGEVELRRKDGTVVPAEGRARAVDLPSGPVYVGTWRDVTERKQLEQMQQEFLATISHDLKNPLTAVKMHAQLLRRRILQDAPPTLNRLREGLDAIVATADRMEGLLDDLSDVARLRLGQPLDLRPEPTDLVELAGRGVDQHRRATERHRIRLEAAVPQLIGVWDPARLTRVLDNLLGNAVKYSPDGGEIEVRVFADADTGGRWAVLAVRDSGVGIPAADLPNIFRRGYRAANVVGRFVGSGIGLAGTRQIVEQHGGTIAAVGEEGRGSTFIVRLPLSTPA